MVRTVGAFLGMGTSNSKRTEQERGKRCDNRACVRWQGASKRQERRIASAFEQERVEQHGGLSVCGS